MRGVTERTGPSRQVERDKDGVRHRRSQAPALSTLLRSFRRVWRKFRRASVHKCVRCSASMSRRGPGGTLQPKLDCARRACSEPEQAVPHPKQTEQEVGS